MSETKATVSLPEGVSLKRVGQVLLDAWEVGSHQWKDAPLELREGEETPPPPIPRDAPELFRLLNPNVAALFAVLEPHIPASDLHELRTLVSEEQQRRARLDKPPGA